MIIRRHPLVPMAMIAILVMLALVLVQPMLHAGGDIVDHAMIPLVILIFGFREFVTWHRGIIHVDSRTMRVNPNSVIDVSVRIKSIERLRFQGDTLSMTNAGSEIVLKGIEISNGDKDAIIGILRGCQAAARDPAMP